jgi:hypothetical protein
MADKYYTCKQCNAGFIASHKRAFCTDKCKYRHGTLKRNPDAVIRLPIEPCVCTGCNKTYIPKARDRNKYCSRECAYSNINAWAKWHEKKKERTRNPFSKVWFKVCSHCTKSFTTRWQKQETCSLECARAKQLVRKRNNYVPVVLNSVPCVTCGKEFDTNRKRSVYCSKGCVPRRNSARDRARRVGAIYEIVNVMRVFKRDGWICQICGVKTPQSRRGTLHKRAPEIDHRVPFALGGSHTYDNVQCSCRECNNKKGGHRIVGQLALFPA